MEKTTFSDGGVAEMQTSKFVSAALDVDKSEAVADKYGVEGVPATYFVAPDGEILSQFVGGMGAAAYRDRLTAVLEGVAAIKGAKEGLAKEPGKAELHGAVGEAYARMANEARARQAFDKAVELIEARPDKTEADLRAIAAFLVKIGDVQVDGDGEAAELRETANRLEKADPSNRFGTRDNVLFLRASVAYMEDKYDDMLAGMREIVEKHPDSDKIEDATLGYGWVLLSHKKDKEAAAKVIRGFLERFPQSKRRDMADHMLKHATGEHGDHDD
jgi:TolA-binding protein